MTRELPTGDVVPEGQLCFFLCVFLVLVDDMAVCGARRATLFFFCFSNVRAIVLVCVWVCVVVCVRVCACVYI